MKHIEQYFRPVVFYMLSKMFLTFESVCDQSNESF